jgi:hypothetical protein
MESTARYERTQIIANKTTEGAAMKLRVRRFIGFWIFSPYPNEPQMNASARRSQPSITDKIR